MICLQGVMNDVSNDSACSSSSNVTKISTAVTSIKSLNSTVQSLSEHSGLFLFQCGKVFICLDCERVLTGTINLHNHLSYDHGVETDNECCEELHSNFSSK